MSGSAQVGTWAEMLAKGTSTATQRVLALKCLQRCGAAATTGDPKAFAAVLDALEDRHPEVRREAIEVLAAFDCELDVLRLVAAVIPTVAVEGHALIHTAHALEVLEGRREQRNAPRAPLD